MIEFYTEWLFPKFILGDKTGYAMAKAITAALTIMDETVEAGIKAVTDVDTMPEWRLDEMAREYHCLYDFKAGIAAKREWIRLAMPHYRIYGTPRAVYQYLEGFFKKVEIEEGAAYGAEPFHFRVTASGEAWTAEKEAWARKAIGSAKNVRSVLDNIAVACKATVEIRGSGGVEGTIEYPLTGDVIAGTWPE